MLTNPRSPRLPYSFSLLDFGWSPHCVLRILRVLISFWQAAHPMTRREVLMAWIFWIPLSLLTQDLPHALQTVAPWCLLMDPICLWATEVLVTALYVCYPAIW